MYIHDQLKKLRLKTKMTLENLSNKVGYGTGNLSSYETGKIKPKDATLKRILVQGYEKTKKEAVEIIAMWRKKELEKQYNLSQNTEKYNSPQKKKSLDEFLKEEGFDKKTIQKIKKNIEKYKKENN